MIDRGKCFWRVQVPPSACGQSRPAVATELTINWQAAQCCQKTRSTRSTETESVCKLDQVDAVEGRRHWNLRTDEKHRVDSNNGDGKRVRQESMGQYGQHARRVAGSDSQRALCSVAEGVGASPTSMPTAVRMAPFTVTTSAAAVQTAVWDARRIDGSTPSHPVFAAGFNPVADQVTCRCASQRYRGHKGPRTTAPSETMPYYDANPHKPEGTTEHKTCSRLLQDRRRPAARIWPNRQTASVTPTRQQSILEGLSGRRVPEPTRSGSLDRALNPPNTRFTGSDLQGHSARGVSA